MTNAKMNSLNTNAMNKSIGNKVTITVYPIPNEQQMIELVTAINNVYKNNRGIEIITQYSTTTIRITL